MNLPNSASYDDFYGEDSSDGDFDDSILYEDRSTLRRETQPMGYSIGYVPEWGPAEAFREFTQNWKDAIIETNQFRQNECQVIVKGFDSNNIYTAEVRHPRIKSLLGFIRWQDGTVEISNFKAQMTREMLDIGVTTKRSNHETAGKHGEGFKVGALVMTRTGYRVRYEASSFYWAFKFGGRLRKQLYCSLAPMAENKIKKLRERQGKRIAARVARGLQSYIWKDVSVKIGRVQGIGEKVRKEDFLSWVTVSLDLDRPSKIIETLHGSLILDKEFAGRIYLKSLLLKGKSFEKPMRFGYNFYRGSVERDRTSLKNTGQEARILAEIWAEAIHLHERDTIDEYVELLRADETADVNQAEEFMSEFTAEKVWSRLLEQDPGRRCFYHDTRNADKDAEIIRNSLKRKPVQLPTPLWESLRKFNLVRAPREQQFHLLHNAPVAEDNRSPYSAGVCRALRAALALDVKTKDLKVIFKNGAMTDFDLILFESTLEINNKWLDFKQSHSEAACWLSRQSNDESSTMSLFSCDHIALTLYELVLEEVTRDPRFAHRESSESKATLCQTVSENLRHMPMMIEACLGGPGEIIVSWIDRDGGMVSRVYGLNPKLEITLHQESSCAFKRYDLLRSNPEPATPSVEANPLGSPRCGCPSMVVPQKYLKVTFTGLDPHEEYFPMISREDPQAFFGLAPESLRPRAPLSSPLSVQTRVGQSVNNALRRSSPPKVVIDNGNLYDAYSSDGEIMHVDSPIPLRPSSRSSTSSPENQTSDVLRNRRSRATTPSRAQMRQELQDLRTETKSRQQQLAAKDQEKAILAADLESETQQFAKIATVNRRLREENRNADRDLKAANERIEHLTIEYQEVTSSIDALRVKLQELQHRIQEREKENAKLESKLVEAEHAYDQQLILAASTAARRQDPPTRVKREKRESRDLTPPTRLKRERAGSPDLTPGGGTLGWGPKRLRNITTAGEDGPVVDLTGDGNVGNSASSTSWA